MLDIVSTTASGLYDQEAANRMVAAAVTVASGQHPTGPNRRHFGVMVFFRCDAANQLGYRDVHAESLYRKLMGHDWATMGTAPYPLSESTSHRNT